MNKSQSNSTQMDFLEFTIKLYRLFKKHIVLIIIFLTIGIGYSIYKQVKKEQLYNTRIIMKADIENIRLIDEIFNNLNELIKKNKQKASIQLGVDIKTCNKLKNLEFSFPEEKMEKLPDKYTTLEASLKLEHQLVEQVENLSRCFENYINHLPYLKQMTEKRANQLKQEIHEIQKKIKETDSIQSLYLKSYLLNNKLIYVNQDGLHASMNELKLELIKEKHKLELDLAQVNPVYFIDSITVKKSGDLISFIVYIGGSLIISLMIIFFIEVYRKEKKDSNEADK